jgi:hypothetical protein
MPTTAEAIRDRMLTVIEALVPASDIGVRYRRYRAEGGARFEDWAEKNATGARRRVHVRYSGDISPPQVSDTVVIWDEVTFTIVVAYPQTARDGAAQALDRDDTGMTDARQILKAIGLHGKANFTAPYPDATWLPSDPEVTRQEGANCDFQEITVQLGYYLAL